MDIVNLIFGKPLKSSEERAEQIGPAEGIPIFGLDALSSAAYGPEAALSLLIPLGLLGVRYIVPISAAIITLLVIVYFSYRQTIEAYPTGGGSYTVARYNLGSFWGLLAAAALLADYIFDGGGGNFGGRGRADFSGAEAASPHDGDVPGNPGGDHNRESARSEGRGIHFLVPTYLFVGCLVITIAVGVVRTLLSGGHPVAAHPLPTPPAALQGVTYWLLLRVFASGCTALTGVEAVSNGVRAFREPRVKKRATDTDDYYCDPGRAAGRDIVPGEGVRDCGDGPWATRIPKRAFAVDCGGVRQERFLLRVDRIDPACAFAFGEYRVCGFPAVVPLDFAEQLFAARIRAARAATGVHAGDRGAGDTCGSAAVSVWRRDRSADSALRGGGVSGVHAFAGGDGAATGGKRGGRTG